MIALLSLTNSSSNQSDITQLPFRPPSKWSHFSREHSSMSTESFHRSPCQCCNCRDEGRGVILKICPLLYVLTAWKSQPWHGLEKGMKNVTAQESRLTHGPDRHLTLSHFKDSTKRRFLGSCDHQLNKGWPKLSLTHRGPSSQHMGSSSSG